MAQPRLTTTRLAAMKSLIQFLAVALLLSALGLTGWAWQELQAAEARLQAAPSQLVDSPYGPIEFLDSGPHAPTGPTAPTGPVVLVIHGSGGGFDQGALLAEAALPPGVRWIAPSRFGYLRSGLPDDASFDTQADAYDWLLQHLGLRQPVTVLALSHGGPSALLFALRHPDRTAGLILLSAGVAATDAPNQAQADRQGKALDWVFQQDWRYWLLARLARQQLFALMGAGSGNAAGMDAAQRRLADAVVDGMHPVSRRAAGVRFDHRATLPGARIAAIHAPTLLLHARDDSLQVFAQAEFAVRHIAGAQLLAFDRGGHLLLAFEHTAVRAAVAAHLTRTSTAPFPSDPEPAR